MSISGTLRIHDKTLRIHGKTRKILSAQRFNDVASDVGSNDFHCTCLRRSNELIDGTMTAVGSCMTSAVCVDAAASALGIALRGPTYINFALNIFFPHIRPLSAHHHVLSNSKICSWLFDVTYSHRSVTGTPIMVRVE